MFLQSIAVQGTKTSCIAPNEMVYDTTTTHFNTCSNAKCWSKIPWLTDSW